MKPGQNTFAKGAILSMVLCSSALLAEAASDSKPVVEGNTAFACDLYQKLCVSEGNLFFSPYSISTAMAMTYGGAGGDTARQIAAALHFSVPQEQLHSMFASLESGMKKIQQGGKVQIHVANSLWPQEDYHFHQDYLDLAKKFYGVAITPVNFAKDANGASQAINKWVTEKTQNKINNLIQPDALDRATRLMLVNAIYFKGDWMDQFVPADTRKEIFTLAKGKTVKTMFMNRRGMFSYRADNKMQLLELPYIGQSLSMIILLPRQVEGLDALEKTLASTYLAKLFGGVAQQDVILTLPKFKLTKQFYLNRTLAELGMPDAFDVTKADFAGMDGTRNLYISSVIHKAFVEVDEKGTEAAAVTAVSMNPAISIAPVNPPKPEIFRADHPFIFMIRENKTGSILFMGRVADPTKTGD